MMIRTTFLAAFCAFANAVVGQPVSFEGIRVTPGASYGDDLQFEAVGISADGSRIWGTAASPDPEYRYEAFRWTRAGGAEFLGSFDGSPISQVVGSSSNASVLAAGATGATPLRWSETRGWETLGVPDEWSRGALNAASDDGSALVGHARRVINGVAERVPAVWREGQAPITLQLPQDWNPESAARSISGDGSTIVGYGVNQDGLLEAFRWTEPTGAVGLGTIDDPNYVHSFASATSTDGDVVIGSAFNGLSHRGFRWTATGGMEDIGYIVENGTSTKAIDVSADGRVIVGWTGGSFGKAFLWDADHGMRDLRDVLSELAGADLMAGWTRMGATGISADGLWITGKGINPSGEQEIWVAHIPAPPTLGLILAGAALLRRRTRRMRW